MSIELSNLPFEKTDLEPYMSRETLEFHHEKHHRAYVKKTNELIKGTVYEKLELQEIVLKSYNESKSVPENKKIFNNSAQAWNHDFFWKCLSPDKTQIDIKLKKALEINFESVEKFQNNFSKTATELFGSGWAWLVKNQDGTLAIVSMSNAGNPLTKNQAPLLTCDVWEHAYYIDYRNDRPKYLENFWKLTNWEFALANYENAHTNLSLRGSNRVA